MGKNSKNRKNSLVSNMEGSRSDSHYPKVFAGQIKQQAVVTKMAENTETFKSPAVQVTAASSVSIKTPEIEMQVRVDTMVQQKVRDPEFTRLVMTAFPEFLEVPVDGVQDFLSSLEKRFLSKKETSESVLDRLSMVHREIYPEQYEAQALQDEFDNLNEEEFVDEVPLSGLDQVLLDQSEDVDINEVLDDMDSRVIDTLVTEDVEPTDQSVTDIDLQDELEIVQDDSSWQEMTQEIPSEIANKHTQIHDELMSAQQSVPTQTDKQAENIYPVVVPETKTEVAVPLVESFDDDDECGIPLLIPQLESRGMGKVELLAVMSVDDYRSIYKKADDLTSVINSLVHLIAPDLLDGRRFGSFAQIQQNNILKELATRLEPMHRNQTRLKSQVEELTARLASSQRQLVDAQKDAGEARTNLVVLNDKMRAVAVPKAPIIPSLDVDAYVIKHADFNKYLKKGGLLTSVFHEAELFMEMGGKVTPVERATRALIEFKKKGKTAGVKNLHKYEICVVCLRQLTL